MQAPIRGERSAFSWLIPLTFSLLVLAPGYLLVALAGPADEPEQVAAPTSVPAQNAQPQQVVHPVARPDSTARVLSSELPAPANVEPVASPSVAPIASPEPPRPAASPSPSVLRAAGPAVSRQSATLPILMYHYVDNLPATETDIFRKDLTVSPANFERQLQYFAANNVKTVSLDALMAHLRGDDPLPDRSVVLTFDDGYADNYAQAYPLLRKYGMTGTFFVVANLVETPGYMTWDQLREMERNGMSIESHSLDHVDLAKISKTELERQLKESKRILDSHLARPVKFLCYPGGKYNPQVISAAKAAGYDAATTVNHGLTQLNAEPFELNRVRVRGTDNIAQLAAKMVPSDWKLSPGRSDG